MVITHPFAQMIWPDVARNCHRRPARIFDVLLVLLFGTQDTLSVYLITLYNISYYISSEFSSLLFAKKQYSVFCERFIVSTDRHSLKRTIFSTNMQGVFRGPSACPLSLKVKKHCTQSQSGLSENNVWIFEHSWKCRPKSEMWSEYPRQYATANMR